MEHALAERTYKALFDSILDGVQVIDIATGRILQANKTAATLFGFDSPENLIGVDLLDYFPSSEDRARLSAVTLEAVEKDLHSILELRARRRDGREIWVALMGAKVDFDGRPAKLISLRDITAQKQAEHEVRNLQERQMSLLNSSSDLILIVKDWKIAFVNRRFEEVMGVSGKTLLGLPVLDMTHPNDRKDVAERYQKILDGEWPQSPRRAYKGFGREQRPRWGEIQEIPFTWEGKPAVMTVIQDVTERREAEEALKSSEERFKFLLDNAREAVLIVQDWKIAHVNHAFEEVMGGSRQDLIGMPIMDIVAPRDRQAARERHSKILSGEWPSCSMTFRGVDKNRKTRWGESREIPMIWDGKPAVLCLIQDVTEQREAEEALKSSEERFRALIENATDAIAILDGDGLLLYASPSTERILGYVPEEVIGNRLLDLVHPDDSQRIASVFESAKAHPGETVACHSHCRHNDGTYRAIEGTVRNLLQNTKINGIVVNYRDITERKQAEQALKDSEERFRTLLENAAEAIVIVGTNGKLTYRSPSAAIIGFESADFVGQDFAGFLHPDDLHKAASLLDYLMAHPSETVSCEVRCKDKTGSWHVIEATGRNLVSDPKINGLVVNYRDITDRKKAEEATRESEERFRNLVKVTSDWVWESDSKGVYTYASPRVREVLGYEVHEIVGRSIFDFMPAREGSRFARTFRFHANRGEPFAFLETTRQRKDGKVIVMETSGVPFFGVNGELLGYRGIGRDITNRKKIEKDLERSVKKLEKTMEATIQSITHTMETRDPYTTGHQRRVTQLACAIAKEMGIPARQIDGIRVAGLLHDIGKIAVPTEILSKPGKLTDIEFSMIKSHPKVGFDILKNIDFEWPIARIVVQHHERLDGSGYPFGISGKDILQEARILAVADVVEAMSSHRPYRPAQGMEKALAEVARGDGTIYDPEVVRACSKLIKEGGFKFQD